MNVIIALKKNENKGFFSKIYAALIKIWTCSKYFHSEIIIDNYWISSYPGCGVELHQLESDFSKDWDYFKVVVPTLTKAQEKIFWNYIKDQKDTGYDWKGIFFSQIFKFGINNNKKWFCSEIVTKILQMLYFSPVLKCVPNKISPAKLYKLIKNYSAQVDPNEIQEIYENN